MNKYGIFRLLFILIVASVTFTILNYYSNDRFSINTPSHDDTIIKKALEELQECTPSDRVRQERILRSLLTWTHFAKTHNIKYWLGYGTLVGYVQRRGLFPHDHDIDLIILGQDTQKLFPFSDVNLSSVYVLKVHPQWNNVGFRNRIRFPSKGIKFVAPNARLINRKYHNYLDIWPTYDYVPDKPRNATNIRGTLTQYSRSYKWISSPKTWTFPLKPCEFSGIQVWCPAMPDRLVSMLYGVESLNKSNRGCVNGRWVPVKIK